MSNVHMAWMRAVCGRLEMRYRYSSAVVYNNFPWPNVSNTQKEIIEQTAKGILDARAIYPNDSLSSMYGISMHPELEYAHYKNDVAVMRAYGFTKNSSAFSSEAACVAELMKLYQKKLLKWNKFIGMSICAFSIRMKDDVSFVKSRIEVKISR